MAFASAAEGPGMRSADALAPGATIELTVPEAARVGPIALRRLVDVVSRGDSGALAAFRDDFPDHAAACDQFVAALRQLIAGQPAAAAVAFGQVDASGWHVAASMFRAVALATNGWIGAGLALANRMRDRLDAPGAEQDAAYMSDRGIITAGLQYIAAIDQRHAPVAGKLPISDPFRYVVSYPRSGSTMLAQFLCFAFAAPKYSVYPGDGRYFSRRFHDHEPGHAVFVKDHLWNAHYIADETLFLVRDGRDAMLSFARFLYAEGHHDLIRRGQLAEFLRFSGQTLFGFWADHARVMLDAQTRGARIQLVRYEEIFGNYKRLMALAHAIAGPVVTPRDDEQGFAQFRQAAKRRLVSPGWSERLTLPEDSYIPQDWSIGGGTIDWRHAFDAPARRAFHELGGTDMLIRLGYETDRDWWRAG